MKERKDFTAANRAVWDASAAAFEAGDDWQNMLAQVRLPGFSVLDESLAHAVLGIEMLAKHPHSNREVDYDIYQGRAGQIPMCYTLLVRKRVG